jgi:hypothetical protein
VTEPTAGAGDTGEAAKAGSLPAFSSNWIAAGSDSAANYRSGQERVPLDEVIDRTFCPVRGEYNELKCHRSGW